ncbi:MAG TPA: ATP-dependent helicase HrpB [Steroidobacteraceae bacterium]|nr:ATP-dependent helicase HrpB [Steroidobacteraceae bacterium]
MKNPQFDLPIDAALPALRAAVAAHANVVLQAPPGAGKSTGVPLALLTEQSLRPGKIVMLEPRRLAARAVATRMAQVLGESVGQTVGFRTRLESRTGKTTRIEVVTEGILTRWLQRDATLEGVAMVIFDEFHERSLNADLGLALCLEAQAEVRDDLRILVMSATLDATAVAQLLGDAPVVTAEGKMFEVDTRWATAGVANRGQREVDIATRIARTIAQALEREPGDILAFLPGQAEIRRAQQQLEEGGLPRGVSVLPLFGDLSAAEQDAALRRGDGQHRKIVLATNIAETSLTIEGVRVVVDSGLARRARFDPSTGMSGLETVRISRASADQRRGRAGRLGPGVCYRLWSESEHASLAAQTAPEILEADLAPVALDLAEWGVSDPRSLRWLDPPPAATFAQARDLLRSLDAIDAGGRITPHGRALARLGTHPRLAHMIVRGAELGLQRLALEIAAVLGERDLLRWNAGRRDADLHLRIEALRRGRVDDPHVAADVRVDGGARQRALRSVEVLARQTPSLPSPASVGGLGGGESDTDIGRLLAFAYPDRIAQSRGAGGRYLLSGGRGARLADAQSIAQAEFLVVADLDAGDREALIRLAAPLPRAALEAALAALIEHRQRFEWDAREQAVVAQDERWLGAIRLGERRLENPDSARVLSALLAGIRELGLDALPWTKEARALRQRLAFAREVDAQAPRPWPDVSDGALLATLDDWLAPWLTNMSRRDHLARLDMTGVIAALLDWNQRQRLDEIAPTHLQVPSGSRIPIDYSAAPTVAVRLQEVFGLSATPAVGGGRVPLTMQLLSPAHRPVQVTKDLASFWARGYTEVKKELKGRYPKHYWPDDPTTAVATARARPRPK